jgi:hypothetical protein
MLNRFLVYFVLCCALLPLYAQEKAPATKHISSVPQKVEQKPADAPSVQILNSVAQQPSTEEKPKSYWARFFAPENLPNILLFVVGLLGSAIALVTLIAIWRQTKAMQDTLDISKRTLLLQFRPVLILRDLRTMGLLPNPTAPEPVEVFLAIENTGGSDAHIISSQIVVKIVDYSIAAFSLMEGAISLGEMTLTPGEGHVKNIPIDDELAKAMIAETDHSDDPNWTGHKRIYCVGNIGRSEDHSHSYFIQAIRPQDF